MSLDIYDAAIPGVLSRLRCMVNILKKAQVFATERKIDESVMFGLRIAPDMLPLMRQVQIVTDNAKGIAARLSQTELPSWDDDETTFEQLFARMEKTISFVESIDREKFAGAEDREVKVVLPKLQLDFTGTTYLFNFGLPNFLFHATMAYSILRHNGVPIGKFDYLSPRDAAS